MCTLLHACLLIRVHSLLNLSCKFCSYVELEDAGF
ncbi:hypothetical protein KC19_6G121300 [Ceratodon purpureus]|uniref:Uncharacterized protein n=1 Tax=Ceratodon purpureus TaxID=3225 RepID=A0A8T0HHS0_CERPU|nr:hypothetical protein KC19_6G121300 [Ceratodon purpureus]